MKFGGGRFMMWKKAKKSLAMALTVQSSTRQCRRVPCLLTQPCWLCFALSTRAARTCGRNPVSQRKQRRAVGPHLMAYQHPLSKAHVIHGDVGNEHVRPTEDPGAAPVHSRHGREEEHGHVAKPDIDTLCA